MVRFAYKALRVPNFPVHVHASEVWSVRALTVTYGVSVSLIKRILGRTARGDVPCRGMPRRSKIPFYIPVRRESQA